MLQLLELFPILRKLYDGRVGRHLADFRREVPRLDEIRVTQDRDSLDDIAELANIARPGVALHLGHRLRCKALDGNSILLSASLQKNHCQLYDVTVPLTERGKIDGHHIETVVQILPEEPLLHHLSEVPVADGDQTDIDLAFSRVAHFPDHLRLQHPQQLRLCLHAQVGHLIHKERAFVRSLEQAVFCGHGAGERALDVAEQLTLKQGRHERTTVTSQQGVILPATQLMDGPGEHLLARTALAGDQNGAVGRSHTLDQSEHTFHRAAVTDDALEPLMDLQLSSQGHVLSHQRGTLAHLLKHHLELIGRKRLAQIVGRTFLHRLHRRLHRRVPGNDDDLGRYSRRLNAL